MKKLILFFAFSMLFTSAVKSEELPEGFYEMEVVKKAIQEQVASLREFTPAQLEVVYQASKILHDEYFGSATAADQTIEGVVLEPGLYEVGPDIPAGNYYFEGVKGRFPSSIHVYSAIDKQRVTDEIQSVSGFGYGYDCKTAVTGKVILQDGWFIKIVQGPVIIHLYHGIFY